MARAFQTSRAGSCAAEAAARIALRLANADQRLRILRRLTMGFRVAHIARGEPLTARRTPPIIGEMLARRDTDPPDGFAQFQIARLSEAMIVARTTMMQGNLHAAERMRKLTGELDRSHGFAQARIPAPPEPSPRRLAARPTAKRSRRVAGEWRRNSLKN